MAPFLACTATAPPNASVEKRAGHSSAPGFSKGDSDSLLMVDCLLPGQIRKLGSKVTYTTPRRPVRTTALDCEIRGGEYVAYDRADLRTSLSVWLGAAEQGDTEAQNYVGEIYEKGLGVAPDFKRAAAWYQQAAVAGSARAQINLGQLYDRGLGVAHDPVEAQRWYAQASGLETAGVPFLPAAASQPSDLERMAELERRGREAKALRSQVEGLEADVQRLQTELGVSDAELKSAHERIDRQRSGIHAKRAGLESEAQVLRDERIALESEARELEAKRAELDRMESEIVGLRSEARAAQQADPIEVSSVTLAGPSIELIEPPIQATRGIEVVASQSAAGERMVVGQIDAPAGLLALTVNDLETPIGSRGLFKRRITVPETGMLVKIVAVDRQGKRAKREFRLKPKVQSAPPPPPEAPVAAFGNYVALVIGNDDYRALPDLSTAAADARGVAELLEQRYGFRVQLMLNVDRYQTLSALNSLRGSLTENDNLLIYYAGHGELDKVNGRGFWLPVDSEPNSTANWISNIAITDILNSMAARHVLVVADSCYSGALTRSALARLEAGMTEEARRTWIRTMLKKRSRTAMTSGGLEPVLDSGGGNHSIFARVLIEVLEQNREVLEGQRIFREVAARVTWAAEGTDFEQVPQYAPIKFAGHESGDFFFVPQDR